MNCIHLQKLFQLCDESGLRFSSSDLVHIVCKKCQQKEVCPSVLVDEYEAEHDDSSGDETDEATENNTTQ
jgi:hypothetical protein